MGTASVTVNLIVINVSRASKMKNNNKFQTHFSHAVCVESRSDKLKDEFFYCPLYRNVSSSDAEVKGDK